MASGPPVAPWITVVDMVWVWTFAVVIVLVVGAAVLPRRASEPSQGFPWFWVAFPLCVLLATGSLTMWLPLIAATGGVPMYMPLADSHDGVQVLGNDQFWQLHAFTPGRWILPITALVLGGLSAWAWRRGRV